MVLLLIPQWSRLATLAYLNAAVTQNSWGNVLDLWANPQDRQLSLYRAETLFYDGKHKQAAELLDLGGWYIEPDLSGAFSGQIPAQPSRLLSVGRYEYYLVSAYQEISRGHWTNAVKAFRLALAHEGELVSSEDVTAFFQASANWHLENDGRQAYGKMLAGKYFVLAEEWSKATELLNSIDTWSELSQEEQAWAALYLGRAYEGEGLWDNAIQAFEQGWQASPIVLENGIRLWQVLVQSGRVSEAKLIEQGLLELGPRYRAGRYTAGYEHPYTTLVRPGWQFVGYDLDPEFIQHSSRLDVWIWWKRTGDAVPNPNQNSDQIVIGPYLLDHQRLTNLIPNAGFEWGERADGIPIGWSERLYSSSPSSLFVDWAGRDSRTGRVIVGVNAVSDSSGLLGTSFPVQSDVWYLMAGWMNASRAANSNIGRMCTGNSFQARGPAFLPWTPSIPDGAWVHIADAVPAFPNDRPDVCRLILINYMNPGGKTIWDDLIFARVRVPQ